MPCRHRSKYDPYSKWWYAHRYIHFALITSVTGIHYDLVLLRTDTCCKHVKVYIWHVANDRYIMLQQTGQNPGTKSNLSGIPPKHHLPSSLWLYILQTICLNWNTWKQDLACILMEMVTTPLCDCICLGHTPKYVQKQVKTTRERHSSAAQICTPAQHMT